MIASKFLISTAAAAAVVGAIGIAYAQTTYPPATGTATDTTAAQPVPTTPAAPTSTATTPATPTPMNSSTPSSGSTDTSATATEPAARADRN